MKMNKIEQQINDFLKVTEDEIVNHTAPDLREPIWQQHQQKKMNKYSVIAASMGLLCLTVLLHQLFYIDETPNVIAENQRLEMRLAKVSTIALSENQQQVINNWQGELELLDQHLESHYNDQQSQKLWVNRTKILTKMINFHMQPIELYEI